jgi:sulfoxide reductase heme-binding subunit YedZ
VFPALLLSLWHDFLQAKADVSAPTLLTGFTFWLLAWRLLPSARRDRPAVLGLLGVAAGLAAALIEAGWYWLQNGLPPARVLATDLSLRFGPRPAVTVALCGLAVALATALRRLPRRPG